jgi:hypothetical protein
MTLIGIATSPHVMQCVELSQTGAKAEAALAIRRLIR